MLAGSSDNLVAHFLPIQLTAASGRWAVGDMVQKLVQNPSYKDEGPLQIYIDFMCKLFGMVPDKAWSKVAPRTARIRMWMFCIEGIDF